MSCAAAAPARMPAQERPAITSRNAQATSVRARCGLPAIYYKYLFLNNIFLCFWCDGARASALWPMWWRMSPHHRRRAAYPCTADMPVAAPIFDGRVIVSFLD